MGIFIWDTAPSKIFVWWSEVASVRAGDTKVRPIKPQLTPLCFTANTSWSTIRLNSNSSPTPVTLETSTDWNSRTTYTIWTTITLNNAWDKIYRRNTSETDTWFSIDISSYYRFIMTWSIAWSGDVTSLLNKNWTSTLSSWCFTRLFIWCSALTTAPELPATTLAYRCYYQMFDTCKWLTSSPALPATTLANECYWGMFRICSALKTPPELPATTLVDYCYRQMFYQCSALTAAPHMPATALAYYCYYQMFYQCTSLATIPALPATTLAEYCYNAMLNRCTKIKVSATQTWEYQTPYRIPTTWTWTTANYALNNMFYGTWWTFKSTPTINTTYYTSNTVV